MSTKALANNFSVLTESGVSLAELRPAIPAIVKAHLNGSVNDNTGEVKWSLGSRSQSVFHRVCQYLKEKCGMDKAERLPDDVADDIRKAVNGIVFSHVDNLLTEYGDKGHVIIKDNYLGARVIGGKKVQAVKRASVRFERDLCHIDETSVAAFGITLELGRVDKKIKAMEARTVLDNKDRIKLAELRNEYALLSKEHDVLVPPKQEASTDKQTQA